MIYINMTISDWASFTINSFHLGWFAYINAIFQFGYALNGYHIVKVIPHSDVQYIHAIGNAFPKT